jgi:hypothetical protein
MIIMIIMIIINIIIIIIVIIIGYSNRSLGAPIDRDELVTELRGDKCQHVAER